MRRCYVRFSGGKSLSFVFLGFCLVFFFGNPQLPFLFLTPWKEHADMVWYFGSEEPSEGSVIIEMS